MAWELGMTNVKPSKMLKLSQPTANQSEGRWQNSHKISNDAFLHGFTVVNRCSTPAPVGGRRSAPIAGASDEADRPLNADATSAIW
jgi:hypothetical protein